MFLLNLHMAHSHDFLSAFRVRFLSRGADRGVDVAVLTNDSNISSSPSVNVSSDNLSAGERSTSGRRRRSPGYGDALSTLSTDGLCVPSNCLQSHGKGNYEKKQFQIPNALHCIKCLALTLVQRQHGLLVNGILPRR